MRGASAFSVGLGPEHREEPIAAVKAVRSGDREIDEQRQASRLGKNTADLGAIGVAEVERSKRSKPQHTTSQAV